MMRFTDPCPAIATLHQLGARVYLDANNRLDVDPGSQNPELARAVALENADWLTCLLLGRRVGMTCRHCTVCNRGVMTRAGASPRCRMTPRCAGTHQNTATPSDSKRSDRKVDARAAAAEPESAWTLGELALVLTRTTTQRNG
jgi:hypothetical protein